MLPEIAQGPIAAEFGEDFFISAAAKKKNPPPIPTCGADCTNPKIKASTESCPAPKPKKRAQDFHPVIQGWSEPPDARL